ncbi:MAG: hypothetical protein BLITH_0580 [Brockia lithotrophica]|uniref:Uncharacterized protein n=1 Tax=Brockia lithotrophica TaxID=933949 RepID=A0A2T5G4M9_9BACL|nr:hypothetical protein [Brockia lithotrophica]MBT9253272.1 hypothetical protein [Brockia lithotrophica]PTQ51150.1 MAG: hypothetical protein BLITH_0580 [Brockia lithotrophica]
MGRGPVTVYVNDVPVIVSFDAQVRHAILAYDSRLYRLVREGKAEIVDHEGHPVDLYGAVGEGWKFHVRLKS